jgi:Xaa-Pro aminopeptidase
MDVAGRLARLRPRVEAAGCDALLVTNLTNIRYLTGFSGSAGMLLVLPDANVLVTDGRYATQSAEQLAAAGVEARIEIGNQPAQKEKTSSAARGIARLGLDAAHVTWARQRAFAAEWFPDAELVATEDLVEELRRVKDDGEVARIAAACRIADDALAAVRTRLLDGPTERELAAELDFEMARGGADAASFATIVAAGPNGAKPHAQPSDRRIRPGELVVIDFGALVDGYHSDMTRTLCAGEPGDDTLAAIVKVVQEAQSEGVKAVRAGVEAKAIDAVCREVIAAAGWGEAFVHSTGHGVGLDIHEYPLLGTTSAASLNAGFVVTVEPGIYLANHGGVRIEDTVVVTAEGCRPLTHAPKELVVA